MMEQMILQARRIILQVRNHKDDGQGLIEYGLIIILISIVVILVLGIVGGEINGMFEDIANGFNAPN